MSDRILICTVCDQEKPDFEAKAVMSWWCYGSTYLAAGSFCPFCHKYTHTIVKSLKGTPERSNYTFELLPICYGHCRTEYGKDKSAADLIPEIKKIRDRKKEAVGTERPKKENDENDKRIDYLRWGITHKYEIFLKQYQSKNDSVGHYMNGLTIIKNALSL